MRLLLIGAPGSGKGTQAVRLAERFTIAHISSGDLLRRHVGDGTALGRMVKTYVDAGDLVPDAVVMDMLYKPVVAAAAAGGYVLDGFPRTVGQAEAAYDVVSELGAQVQAAIHLDVPDDELVRRLLARARGSEDTVDVVQHRLEVYREQTVPLLDYYRRRERLVKIDGSRSVDEVEAAIVRELSRERHLDASPSPSRGTSAAAAGTVTTFAQPATTSSAGHAHPPVRYHLADRNLGLDLMRATEAAALAAGRWAGLGEKERGDGAAVDAMREVLAGVPMRGRVVIGEGEKDAAPMLHNGEAVGDGTGPEIDIAVDPVDGTTLLANGMPNAIAVIAAADRGSMYDPKDVFYMHKLVVGPAATGRVDITAPVEETIRVVAKTLGGGNGDVTVAVLDRPRHADLIARIRATGARIKLFPDGDVAASVAVARPGTGIDLLLGVGGSPEGVITACAMKAMGGEIQALLYVDTDEDRRKALDAGHSLDRVLHQDDLVAGDNTFFVATGITDGDLLAGVRYYAGGARTRSLVMRSRSGTVREVASDHAIDKVLKHSFSA